MTDDDKNFAITRSDDIAKELNENVDSPYYNLIKYPGSPRGKGKIDLSTFVSTLKKYVDVDGKFADNNIKDLNFQSQIVINYFNTLKYHWEKEELWGNASQNVFFKAAGFIAALEFFFEYIFPKCIEKKSFKLDYLISLFDFSDVTLITSSEIKGSDVYHWMMKKREEVNYKDLDFHDPSAPDFWSELNNEIEIHGIRTTIDKMVNDNWLYCFQDEYAILGIPTKRIILTVNEIHRQGRQLEILEEKKQLIDSMSTILSENSVQALEIWKRS